MEDREIPALEASIERIWDLAREFGLDPFPVHFEIVPASIMYEFGAYLLPGRFSHWTHGKAYYQMKTLYDYGLSKIYELVINSDPCFAFLLETNTTLQNKFVVAHVLGHSDFFRNNAYFAGTSRDMPELVIEHARRMRQYAQDVGEVEVEAFMDAVLSIADHVDPYPDRGTGGSSHGPGSGDPARGNALRQRPYEELFPRDRQPDPVRAGRGRRRVPPEPEADLLRYLVEHGDHLEDWQRDILDMVRKETLYFVPQMQTKIMNEGWASFWHNRIMRELDLTGAEFTEFARLHSSVCSPGSTSLNPYYVGLRIWEDIEERYGRDHMFAVREMESDSSFIRLYLTEELCHSLDLFLFELKDDEEWTVTSTDYEDVRNRLAETLTTLGHPLIKVEDGDYRGRRELYLRHYWDGRHLDLLYAEKTLQYLYQLWARPVHLETPIRGQVLVLSCDSDGLSREIM